MRTSGIAAGPQDSVGLGSDVVLSIIIGCAPSAQSIESLPGGGLCGPPFVRPNPRFVAVLFARRGRAATIYRCEGHAFLLRVATSAAAFAVWLTVKGVNVGKWQKMADRSRR